MMTLTDELQKARFVLDALLSDKIFHIEVERIVDICCKALWANKTILFCGNGGSAADSQHLAAELVSRLNFDRPGLAAVALTTDTSIITAIGNDYGFENIFSRQIEAMGDTGDVLIAISTSGNSANIIKAIAAAKDKNITVIGMTGKANSKMIDICDAILRVPSLETQKIQECHIMLGHVICGMIEQRMFQ